MAFVQKSLNLIGYQGDKKGKFYKIVKNSSVMVYVYLANSQVSVYRTIGLFGIENLYSDIFMECLYTI